MGPNSRIYYVIDLTAGGYRLLTNWRFIYYVIAKEYAGKMLDQLLTFE